MGLIVEFTLSNPILQETREAFPEVSIKIEDEHISQKGLPKSIVFITEDGDNLEDFVETLSTDPSIEEHNILSEFDDTKLVQIILSEEGFRGMTYPIAVNLNITFLDIKARGRGMQYRAQVPTREALATFFEQCSKRGLSFQLINLQQTRSLNENLEKPIERFGLTPAQYEVLVHAHERGYFHQPRNITLEELAEELGVSSSALGRRMRRALDTLLEQTLHPDTDDLNDYS